MQKIPSVDLRDFLSDDPVRKQKFVNEIGKAYSEIGFVALKGHFLDDKLVENLYAEVRNFFNLPLEVKSKYEIPGIGGQRGYVSFGKEHAKGRSAGDLKEFWHFGQFDTFSHDRAGCAADQQADNHVTNSRRGHFRAQLVDQADGGDNCQAHP